MYFFSNKFWSICVNGSFDRVWKFVAKSHISIHILDLGHGEGLTHAFLEWVPGGSLFQPRCGAAAERRTCPMAAGADAPRRPAGSARCCSSSTGSGSCAWSLPRCWGGGRHLPRDMESESAVCPDERTSISSVVGLERSTALESTMLEVFLQPLTFFTQPISSLLS